MPMTDVVAQTEKRASPLGSIEKQKAPVETTASRPTQAFRLAGWWTTRRLGGQDQKLYFGAKTSLPYSAPLLEGGGLPSPAARSMTGLFYVRSTTGAKAAASRQDSVRREEASQESRGSLPRRSICSSKTADTSAESRQTELVFFGDKCRPSLAGEGGQWESVPILFTRILRFDISLSGNVRTKIAKHSHASTSAQECGCPFPRGIIYERASLAYGQGRLYGSRII